MKKVLLLIFIFVVCSVSLSQVELVPAEHRVYDFLRRMDAKGVIDFNSAVIPVSRNTIAGLLNDSRQDHSGMTSKLSENDKMLLTDFCKEFEFELKAEEYNPQITQINANIKKRNWVNDNKYIIMDPSLEHTGMTRWVEDNKFLFHYTDSNVAVWSHITAGIYQRNSIGDSLGSHKFFSGDLGFEFRGTMFDRVGFAMSYSNGAVFVGNASDKIFAGVYDHYFRTAKSLRNDGRFFDHFKGYIRYEIPDRWLSLMVGKENIKQGFGFVDNLFFSGVLPYPMINLNLKYKAFAYSYSYGNLEGEKNGFDVENKMISTHRVDVRFAKWMRFGFYESVITNDAAFSFVHLNPFSFITSADLNTGAKSTQKNNTFMGIDLEFKLVKNVVMQGTFLIDDFNLASLNNNDYTANDNKFGYQAGVLWNDAFFLDGLSGIVEYTRLDPFVYTHRENTQQFTHWGYSMGHQLPPNSDEWAFKFDYNFMPRLSVGAIIKFQRSGEGFTYDSLGNIDINYGGNINHGERFFATVKNKFLQGDRVNRSMLGLKAVWEPVRQFILELKYFYNYQNLIYASKKLKDHIFYLNLSLKI